MIIDIQKLLTLVVIIGNYCRGIGSVATNGENIVRKHSFSGSVAANGAVKITLADSMPKAYNIESGEAGVGYDDHGYVRKVSAGGPAHTKGTSEGKQIVKVGAEKPSKDTFGRADKSRIGYEVEVSPGVMCTSREGETTFSGTGAADCGLIRRRSKEVERITVDANGIIEISADLGEEVRDAKLRKDVLREGLRAQNIKFERAEESRRLTTFRINVTRVQSMLRLINVPTIMSPARFITFSNFSICLTSYLATVTLLVLLILVASLIVIMYVQANVQRNNPVRQILRETMHRFGIRLRGFNGSDASDDSDATSEDWEGEGQHWEGFLWKLNSEVEAEKRSNWKQWRMRYFFLRVGVLDVDENQKIPGIYVEFISEKGNMAGVRHWVTQRNPAIVKRLDPIDMKSLSPSESEEILLKASQYQIAVDVGFQPVSELPPTLYALSVKFKETNTDLIVATSDRHLIRELASRLVVYSNPHDHDLFDNPIMCRMSDRFSRYQKATM